MRIRGVGVVAGALLFVSSVAVFAQTHKHQPVMLEEIQINQDVGRGNLLGIQPRMTMDDFLSEENYYNAMKFYLERAKAKGWLSPKTVVLYPEYVGTYLVLVGEDPKVLKAKTTDDAITKVVFPKKIGAYIKGLWNSRGASSNGFKKGAMVFAAFSMKSKEMLGVYHRTFSRLAAEYNVTLVAGSIVLPKIRITGNGKGGDQVSIIDKRHLYNTTIVYYGDGRADPRPIFKINPTPDETPFTSNGKWSDLPIFDTPAGKMGVLNCADSWYMRGYEYFKQNGVSLVAVPSYIFKRGSYEEPWNKNYISAPPEDATLKDHIQNPKFTYGMGWDRFTIRYRLQDGAIPYGMNVFLRGDFFQDKTEGKSNIMNRGEYISGKRADGAALQNLWIE